MLTRLIVSTFGLFVEIALWLFLIAATIAAWHFGGRNALAAIAGLIGGFFFSVLFFGAVLLLGDIRKAVRAMESRHSS